jgi:hypothetical protein
MLHLSVAMIAFASVFGSALLGLYVRTLRWCAGAATRSMSAAHICGSLCIAWIAICSPCGFSMLFSSVAKRLAALARLANRPAVAHRQFFDAIR